MIRRPFAFAGVFLAGCALTAAAQPAAAPPAVQAPSHDRILVLPFENAGNDALSHWLGEATAVLIADGLNDRGDAVISREERVRAFEELHLPLSATLSRATLIKIAHLLGAAELVVGTFRVEDRQLTIQAHPIRVDTGRVRAPVAERGPLTDLFDLHDRLVRHLAAGTSPAPCRFRAAAAAGLRELHQRPRGCHTGGPRDLSRVRDPGRPGVRPRAAGALGRTHGSRRPCGGAGRRQRRPWDLLAGGARALLRRALPAQPCALRRGLRRLQ